MNVPNPNPEQRDDVQVSEEVVQRLRASLHEHGQGLISQGRRPVASGPVRRLKLTN
jgi:hypothetical protein